LCSETAQNQLALEVFADQRVNSKKIQYTIGIQQYPYRFMTSNW